MVDKTKETDEVKRARIQQMADEATKEISKKEEKEKKGKGPAGSRAKETYLNPDFKEGKSTKKVKAKDGSRTKVRGTGAATKGFRKARLS